MTFSWSSNAREQHSQYVYASVASQHRPVPPHLYPTPADIRRAADAYGLTKAMHLTAGSSAPRFKMTSNIKPAAMRLSRQPQVILFSLGLKDMYVC